MAAKNTPSMSEELLSALYIKPFTGMIPYLSPTSFLILSEKTPLAKNHWLDLPIEDSWYKGRKKRDPNWVFEAFGSFSDHEANEVREEMLSAISRDFNYYRNISWFSLQMHKTMLSVCCNTMREPTTPTDELTIFTLSQLYQCHSVVYTKSKTWSTIGTSTPMSEKDVYMQCDLKFVLMGRGNFVQLVKKPSLQMPVIPLQPMESVYKSGYYVDVGTSKQVDSSSTLPNLFECVNLPQKTTAGDTVMENWQYCAVHGCDVMDENTCTSKPNDEPAPELETVPFPIAGKVCETPGSSSLQEFNPLNDSEPNLEFDMTDQNNNSKPDLHVKLMQDAKTRKWQVKIRNSTKEQIEFIASPRLLSTLSKADAVVTEHGDTTTVTETPEAGNLGLPGNKDTPLSEPHVPIVNEPSKSDKSNTESCNQKEPVKPIPKPAWPHRCTAKSIDYSSMTAPEETLDSESDDYIPLPEPPPKLNNKCFPSASRIAAQRHKKSCNDHDKPKQDIRSHQMTKLPAQMCLKQRNSQKGN